MEDQPAYGKTDMILYNSRRWILAVSLLYSACAALCLISLFYVPDFLLKGLAAGAAAGCVWGIHKIHRPVCIVCEEAVFVETVRGPSAEFSGYGQGGFYASAAYDEIIGFSDDWKQMYLKNPGYGEMTSLRIRLSLLSLRDKEKLRHYIEEKQRKS